MTQNGKNTPVPPTRAELIDQVSSLLSKGSAELSPDANLLEEGLGSLKTVFAWERHLRTCVR